MPMTGRSPAGGTAARAAPTTLPAAWLSAERHRLFSP